MYKRLMLLVSLCTSLLLSNSILADEFATKSEAEAMVKKAVAHINSVGIEKAAEDFTDRKGNFVDRDLYVSVTTREGVVLAAGQNKKSVDKNLLEMKDSTGHPFIKERIEMAKKEKSFWQSHTFTDPVTKKILPKETYCETVKAGLVCAGVYKR